MCLRARHISQQQRKSCWNRRLQLCVSTHSSADKQLIVGSVSRLTESSLSWPFSQVTWWTESLWWVQKTKTLRTDWQLGSFRPTVGFLWSESESAAKTRKQTEEESSLITPQITKRCWCQHMRDKPVSVNSSLFTDQSNFNCKLPHHTSFTLWSEVMTPHYLSDFFSSFCHYLSHWLMINTNFQLHSARF